VQELVQAYPLGAGRPQDAASLICFLLSEQSRWISGATFSVDGGLACNIR
jgi:NAD(P)-dependent dehydrogenase (short-subunit alcohol dehydrogenase family)